jgi:HEPN domain-containing protein
MSDFEIGARDKPPTWGLSLQAADDDIIDAAILIRLTRFTSACYHATQGVEKLLKAFIVASTGDPYRKIDRAWTRN